MKKVFDGEKFTDTAVCIGNFDGVHRAHAELIKKTVSEAKGLTSVVYTFFPHPCEVFGKELKKITSEAEKDKLIEALGADVLFRQRCDKSFLAESPEYFAEHVLFEELGAKKVFVGYDFTFGKNSSGNGETLKKLGEKFGFEVGILPEKKTSDGLPIKSSAVREYVEKGLLNKANEMLGRALSYSGEVFHGKKLGRQIGFPTANIYPDEGMVLLPYGVYATKILIDGKSYFGISNIGINPTVENGSRPKIETNIADFDGDIYGKRITVCFYEMIRKEEKFSNVSELTERIKSDCEKAKKIIDKTEDVW